MPGIIVRKVIKKEVKQIYYWFGNECAIFYARDYFKEGD